MKTTGIEDHECFWTALRAPGRSPAIAESDDLYGWLIGRWDLDVLHYRIDIAARHIKGEVHFAWVLEGYAIQDVWIMPRRSERRDDLDPGTKMYGTTLRVWDPEIKAWRITWINPARNHREEQIGRRSGDDIVQIGTRFDGTPTRWRYTDITPESFYWIGEALQRDGHTWLLEAAFRARRMG